MLKGMKAKYTEDKAAWDNEKKQLQSTVPAGEATPSASADQSEEELVTTRKDLANAQSELSSREKLVEELRTELSVLQKNWRQTRPPR